jgi:hypothetical protein
LGDDAFGASLFGGVQQVAGALDAEPVGLREVAARPARVDLGRDRGEQVNHRVG